VIDTAQVIESDTWRVRLAYEADLPGQLELAAREFGDKESGRAEYFDWLNVDTPAGRPVVVVGEDRATGRIAGYVWAMAYKMKVNDEVHTCYMGCNALVHPDFRRSALYSGMLKMQAIGTSAGVALYGFPKEFTLYRVHGAGFKPVARVPLLVRPLDMATLTKIRVPKLARRLAMTIAWPIAAQTVFRPRPSLAWRWRLKLTEALTFDASFDRFWERVSSKYNVGLVRDRAFLLWRFRGASFRDYQILTACAGDELVGYVVLRDYETDEIKCGMIADLLVEPGPRGDSAGLLLVNEATRRLKAHGMALAGALMMPHAQEYRILRRAGYLQPPQRMAPQTFRIVAHAFRFGPYQGTVPPADQCFFTMADHDAI
jgi:hypothetical protein